MRSLPFVLAIPMTLAACAPSTKPEDSADTSARSSGLPEGESVWEGTITFLRDQPVDATLTLQNTGGDLAGTVEFADGSGFSGGSYSVRGTHDPATGAVALVPETWIEAGGGPEEFTLLGFDVVYDPDAGSLAGLGRGVMDAMDEMSGAYWGGDAALSFVSGDGAPTPVPDAAAGIAAGEYPFSGVTRCQTERPTSGSLTFDAQGDVSGLVHYGDIADYEDYSSETEYLGSFDVHGVYNRATGTLALIPDLWNEEDLHIINFLNFFIIGAGGADGSFTGDHRAPRDSVPTCVDGGWNVTL